VINNVPQARRILITVAIAFLLVDIGAAVVLFSPMGRSPAQREDEHQRLRLERMQKDAEARPMRDMDKKIVASREAIGDFYSSRLPSSYSEISESLGKTAAENHVTLSAVKYDQKATGIGGLTNIPITLSLTGEYVSLMRFINALERDKKFFVLDRVVIGDTGANNQLRVDVLLETFLRNPA
jgi:type IV pilus assembly protein PilO